MTRYPHFAFPNIYLVNGYTVTNTHRGEEMEFAREDDLEQCIRRIVLRKPSRLRGWDLRFLRRGLSMTQAELGAYVDRDEQTIARWEKTEDSVPRAVDVVIRMRFAACCEPSLSIKEVLSFVDGKGPMLPPSIFLRLTDKGWRMERQPRIQFVQNEAVGEALVHVGPRSGALYRIFDEPLFHMEDDLLVSPSGEGRAVVAERAEAVSEALDLLRKQAAFSRKQLFKVTVKGSADDDACVSIH